MKSSSCCLRLTALRFIALCLAKIFLTLPTSALTLQEALDQAFSENLGLQIEAINPAIARDQVGSAFGIFDPEISFEASYTDSEKVQNTIEFLSTGEIAAGRIFEDEKTLLRTGIGMRSPIGTEVELFTRVSELDNTINRESPLAINSPEYESFAGVSLRQPLLKNFGTAANLADLRMARLDVAMAEHDQQIAVTNVAVGVIDTYCDLVFAQLNLSQKEEAKAVAEQLVRETTAQVKNGFLNAIDEAEARVQLSEREEEVVLASDFLNERRNALAQLLGMESPDAIATMQVTFPDLKTGGELDPGNLLLAAKKSRPDYLRAVANQDKSDVALRRFERNSLPTLDLAFSYGLNGLGSGYEDAYSQLSDATEPSWSVGFVFSMPLGNITGRAERMAQVRRQRQSQLEVTQVEQSIRYDVKNALRRLDTLVAQISTAEASVRLAQDTLSAEQQRLEVGQTTAFRVLEIADKLGNARTRKLAAETQQQKAIAQLWAASGQLLPRFNYALADEPTGTDSFYQWLTRRNN